jgi:hypothetical protein
MPDKRFFPGAGIHWTLSDFPLLVSRDLGVTYLFQSCDWAILD